MKIIRSRCPMCGQMVNCSKDERFDAHETTVCHGSHMTYGSCKGASKVANPELPLRSLSSAGETK